MTAHVIEARDLTVAYHESPVLWDLDIDLEEGKATAIVGPNRAGKSTMLKLMAGLIEPWSGRVEILGAPAGREARRGWRGTADIVPVTRSRYEHGRQVVGSLVEIASTEGRLVYGRN